MSRTRYKTAQQTKQKFQALWAAVREKVVRFCRAIWADLRDRRTFILFLVVVVLMYTPVWGGFLLYGILGIPWFLAGATAYLAFWAGPFTPFFPMCVAITLALKKLLWRKRK